MVIKRSLSHQDLMSLTIVSPSICVQTHFSQCHQKPAPDCLCSARDKEGLKYCWFIRAAPTFKARMKEPGPSLKVRPQKVKTCWNGQESSSKRNWDSWRRAIG